MKSPAALLLLLLPGAVLWPQSRAARTQFSAVRRDTIIEVQGRLKGKPLKKEPRIDDDPWCQPIEYALFHLLAAHQDASRFWYLDPDECEIHEMEARKGRAEALRLGDGNGR